MILKHPKKGEIKPKQIRMYENCKIFFVNCEKKNHQQFKNFSVSYKSGF